MKTHLTRNQESTDPTTDISVESFETIRRILRYHKGFQLHHYKNGCIRRRIGIRLRATRCTSAEEYCNLLIVNPEERDRLLKVLTIHVSQFFRNPSTFKLLRNTIFPYLFERSRKSARTPIRIWSSGCASGEEPYTIAMILRDAFAAELELSPIELLGSDVDATTLEEARKGIYGGERLRDIPRPFHDRWFREDDGKFHLDPEITSMVTFVQSDLCNLWPWSSCDLILCRNVLIYFERSEQERIMHQCADTLGPGGILVLGKAETLVGTARSRFQSICPVERVYKTL